MVRGWVAIGTTLVVLGVEVSSSSAAVLCRKRNGVVVARDTACARRESVIDLGTFGVDAARLEGKQASEFAAAAHGHTGADIAADSITASQLADHQKTVGFPAQALNYDVAGAAIDEAASGLRWAATFSGAAYLMIPRPSDYAGGDVELAIYFYPETGTAGLVEFFVRPRSWDPGSTDVFADASSIGGTPVTVGTTLAIKKQTFTLPANRLGKEFWVVTMQRGGSSETYPDNVIAMGVGLTYTASR
jgi:hypothetical protein